MLMLDGVGDHSSAYISLRLIKQRLKVSLRPLRFCIDNSSSSNKKRLERSRVREEGNHYTLSDRLIIEPIDDYKSLF